MARVPFGPIPVKIEVATRNVTRSTRRPRRLLILGLAAAALVMAGVACSGSKQEPASGGTMTAAKATATPTPAPADVRLAATLRHEGEYEKAIDIYAAVATSEGGQARQDALLAQAQLLSRMHRFAEARDVLQQWLAGAGASADGSTAQYMLASTLDDLGDPQGALDNYDRYIAAGGPASDFAKVERAKMLARLGRTLDAEQAAEVVLASSIDNSFKASFAFSIASAFEQAGAAANALAWYNRVKLMPGGDVASALARTGGIRKRQGDPTWSVDYLQAVRDYPSAGAAPDMLDALDAAGVAVSDYRRGRVDYQAGRDDAARAAFIRAIAAGAHVAASQYYLGALEERAGNVDAAIHDYGLVPQTDTASPLAPAALWWRGRLLDAQGRFAEAQADYGTLATQYPSSSYADGAAFRQGLAAYRAGDRTTAISLWSALAARTSGDDNLRARYWQGRALVEQNGAANDGVLQALVKDAPDSFYGLRASLLLNRNGAKARTPQLNDSPPDWKKIAQYVKDSTGSDPATASDAPVNDPRWAQAAELANVGLSAQSDSVFRDIIQQYASDPVVLYKVTKRLQQEGRTSLAARAATRLLSLLSLQAPPPDDLLRVAYPIVYKSLVSDAATQEKISPLLLLALVRQESFYDAHAGSPAGALGLTQVVPATGKQIAQSLGTQGFTADDLYRPTVSLRFGADYLAQQLRAFQSDAYRALAAYNAGPGAASRAAKAAGTDEDLFVEDLEFGETRAYVKRVMENYARYRQIYEHLPAPSLPR